MPPHQNFDCIPYHFQIKFLVAPYITTALTTTATTNRQLRSSEVPYRPIKIGENLNPLLGGVTLDFKPGNRSTRGPNTPSPLWLVAGVRLYELLIAAAALRRSQAPLNFQLPSDGKGIQRRLPKSAAVAFRPLAEAPKETESPRELPAAPRDPPDESGFPRVPRWRSRLWWHITPAIFLLVEGTVRVVPPCPCP